MNTAGAKLKIIISQGQCNGFQSTQWWINQQLLLSTDSATSLPETFELDINLPCELRVEIAGKNVNTDTKVVDGQIVEDKFIQVEQMFLANYPVNVGKLFEICEYTDDQGQCHHNTYWHRNGQVKIVFDAPDPVSWHLTHNA